MSISIDRPAGVGRHAALRRLPRLLLAPLAAALAMTLLALTSLVVEAPPPFLFAYPAVALVAMAGGAAPAMLTAVLCIAWYATPWLPPGQGFEPPNGVGPGSAAVFLALSAVVSGAAEFAWRHGRRDAPPVLEEDVPSSRGLVTLLALSVLLPMLLFGAVASYSYRDAFEQAAVRADRALRIASEHATKVLDTNEAVIGRVMDAIAESPDEAILAREAELHRRLSDIVRGLPQVQSVWVQDAAGRPLATDRFFPAPRATLDISDRDYFKWHAEGRGGLFVSEPAIGKATGQPFFDTSRRRDVQGGKFGGLVSVSLFPRYFTGFYADLAQAEPGLAVALVRDDGVVLARFPEPPVVAFRAPSHTAFMQRVRAGEREGLIESVRSSVDNELRLVAFRALDRYPLYVTAAIAHPVVISAWQRDITWFAAVLFPMSAVLAWAAWLALRRARRERAALERLQQEVESRLRAEKALMQSQKLEALGLLTGSVAHDFNNLLAVVNNNAHLIERMPPGSSAQPLAAAIRRAVNTGTQLTRQLLAFSKRQPLRPVVVDLRDALPKTLELVRTTVGRQVVVSLQLSADVCPVVVDAAELELALINLALNARDAMPNGGRLSVLVRKATAGDDPVVAAGAAWALIGVSDTGDGMPPEVRERAFEPFFTTKAEGKGTGLGLSQVFGMCAQAGGVARIESEPGRGTTIFLYLPCAEGAEAPAAPPEAAPIERLDGAVLLVEDNAELAHATKLLLESFGAVVTHAASADAALALLARGQRFDAVLSDIMMPGSMNGLGLARHVRDTEPRLPIVLMTGYTAELHAALSSGFEVLPKPCVPESLARALARALGQGAGGSSPS